MIDHALQSAANTLQIWKARKLANNRVVTDDMVRDQAKARWQFSDDQLASVIEMMKGKNDNG